MTCPVRGRPGVRRGCAQRRLTRSACQRSRVRGDTIRRSWLRRCLGSDRASAAGSPGQPTTASVPQHCVGARRAGGAGGGSQRPWRDLTGRVGQASRRRRASPGRRVAVARVLTVPDRKTLAQLSTSTNMTARVRSAERDLGRPTSATHAAYASTSDKPSDNGARLWQTERDAPRHHNYSDLR